MADAETIKNLIRSFLQACRASKSAQQACIAPLNDKQRNKIYQDLSIGEDEKKAFRKFGRHQLKKSLSLAKEGLLLQSIEKVEQAMFLRPYDPKPLVMLMRLYMPNYRNNAEKALFYAQEVLLLDPSHEIAKTIVSPPKKPYFRYLFAASFAACVLFVLFVQFWSVYTPPIFEDTDENTFFDTAVQSVRASDSTSLASKPLPLSLENPVNGMVLVDHGSTLSTTEESITYELNALLHNQGTDQWGTITGTVSLLDEFNNPIVQQYQELRPFYELPLGPNQTHVLHMRLYKNDIVPSSSPPVRVVVDIENANSQAAEVYEFVPVSLDWIPSEGNTLSIQVQHRPYTPEQTGTAWKYVIGYQILNIGSDITRLKLKVSFLDNIQQELAAIESLLTFPGRPIFASQETRLLTIRQDLPSQASEVVVSVLELE